MKKVFFFALAFLLSVGIASAQSADVDYARPGHWLSAASPAEKNVDIFYLYPTVWGLDPHLPPAAAAINDAAMLENAGRVMREQVGRFHDFANIFAPCYRQVSISTLGLPQEEQDRWLQRPVEDSLAAFTYYIDHLNQERPFILAAHSQGTLVMQMGILSRYFSDHPAVQARMVAAYVLGFAVTEDYLAANPHLKFAQGRTDTSVIVSWNIEAPGVNAKSPVLKPGTLVINPISWVRTAEPASASASLGASLTTFGQGSRVLNFCDATLNLARGSVECSTIDSKTYSIPDGDIFPAGVFHTGDFAFYFYDLRQNMLDRITAFANRAK